MDGVDTAEKHAIEAFVQLVLKLNENSFKPLFMKLLEWGLGHDFKSSDKNRSEIGVAIEGENSVSLTKTRVFYRIVGALCACLKVLWDIFFQF